MPNIEQIKRGQFPLARDWNALADRYNGGAIGLAGYDVRRRLLSAGLVVIKNTSGSDRARFDCMALGDCTQTIDNDAQASVIFAADTADTADAGETPVILQEPIANGQFGIGCVFGVTLAKLEQAGAATDVYGTPNGTNHNLDCGSTETTIKILSAPSTSADSLRPVLIGAGGAGGGVTSQLCKTPVGGIPAATGAGTGGDPYVWGSASCFPIDEDTGVTGGTANVTVKNSTSLDIGGDVVIQVKTIGSLNFVDVAGGCGT